MQEKEAQDMIRFNKVKGLRNPADLGTKCLPEDLIVAHLKAMGAQFESGRAETAPKLLSTTSGGRSAGVPLRQSGRQRRASWRNLAEGTWEKEFKGARASRTIDHGGPNWDRVVHCRVEDKHTGEFLFDRYVGNTHASDPALHAIFKCPRDIVVTLHTGVEACV